MKIEVTREHIKNGAAKTCAFCPVALALQSQWRPKARVGNIDYWDNEHWEMIELPIEVQRFVARFDQGLDVEPFTFNVE